MRQQPAGRTNKMKKNNKFTFFNYLKLSNLLLILVSSFLLYSPFNNAGQISYSNIDQIVKPYKPNKQKSITAYKYEILTQLKMELDSLNESVFEEVAYSATSIWNGNRDYDEEARRVAVELKLQGLAIILKHYNRSIDLSLKPNNKLEPPIFYDERMRTGGKYTIKPKIPKKELAAYYESVSAHVSYQKLWAFYYQINEQYLQWQLGLATIINRDFLSNKFIPSKIDGTQAGAALILKIIETTETSKTIKSLAYNLLLKLKQCDFDAVAHDIEFNKNSCKVDDKKQ